MGSFSPAVPSDVNGVNPSELVVGDFDGKPGQDIAVTNITSDSVSIPAQQG